MSRLGKAAVLAGALALAAACASVRRTPAGMAPPVDWPARVAEADGLYAAGHYTALWDALRIYREALTGAPEKAGLAEKYVRAAIAFELRKKDLGVLSAGSPVDLEALAAAEPGLARYAAWLELLEGLPSKIKGSPGPEGTGGITLEARLDWVSARVPEIERTLESEAETDDLAAALRLALRTEFFYKFRDKLDPGPVRSLHPGSRLVAFQAAVSPAFELEPLEALLAEDPGFSEVHYYVGEAALLAGKLLTAEREYLAVHEKIPESLSVLVSLAKVAFQIEELDVCLDWNEEALALLPTYRDALLGRGLCLGQLGRNEEALAVLGRLLELGTYYQGEAHYWTAWNLNDLGRYDEARRSIDSAKVFLVDVVDVHTLSGIIAYKQGRLDEAERDLRRTLDLHSSEADAAFYLGRLYGDREDWLNSGIYFAGAAMSYEDWESSLENKIEEIEGSEMSAARKARLVARKRAKIRAVRATKATCQYNGAAGYHNAGSFDRALELARAAAAHPAFAERAAELIKVIQGR
jgi:tetratricopeptide (TPR) repeat protein